jgi:hypothetical protein
MSNPLDCAKTQWLREFLETNLPLVEHLTPDTPDWQAQAHTFADKLKMALTDRGLTDPNQQKNHRSQVANALRVCHPHHPAIPYPYTLLESETYTQLNLEQTLKTEQRLTKFFTSEGAIALVEKAESLLNSDDPNDMAASLALLVGRRISEILISQFEPCTTYSLWFSYPVKKVSSITFGGKDFADLYITTAGGDNRKEEGREAGALFRVRTMTQGVGEYRSRITL